MASSGNRTRTYNIVGNGSAMSIETAGEVRRVEVRRIVSGISYVDYVWHEGDPADSAVKTTMAAAYAAPATITSDGITVGSNSITLGTDITVDNQLLKITVLGS